MSMRAEFEKWYSQEGEYSGLPLDCFDEDGDYVDDFVQSMWMAWQAARTQGSQGAEAIGWVHSKHLKELECGHPIRVYPQNTPVVFDSKVPVYTQPQTAVPGEEIHVNVEGDDVYTLPLQPSVMGTPRFVVHVPAAEKPKLAGARHLLFRGWPGCSNHDCIVTGPKTGMGTNGSCTCLQYASRGQLTLLAGRLAAFLGDAEQSSKGYGFGSSDQQVEEGSGDE